MDLKIDPEFRDKIPPLTDAEFEQLRENILADGEVYEPICIWNGTIVDGHNRYKIVQEHPEIPYRTKEMQFADKWEAFEWMYKKQLGRRNLTDEQRTVLIGKMYEARKRSKGAQVGNKNAEKQMAQNEPIESGPSATAKVIAKELGIGKETVKRAEKFAKGVDAIKEVSPEAAETILKGNSGVTKAAVMELPKKTDEEKKSFAEAVLSGSDEVKKARHKQKQSGQATPVSSQSNDEETMQPKNAGFSKEMRDSYSDTDKAYSALTDQGRTVELTVGDLADEIQANSDDFTNYLKRTIKNKSFLLKSDNQKKIITEVLDYVIEAIEKVREEIEAS